MPRPSWTTAAPLVGGLLLAASWGRDLGPVMLAPAAAVLIGSVLAAVHHAEVVAHRVGEPLGSLVLAVAVTVIEVALIVTLMVTAEKDVSGLARDTVFAAVMISINGIVGLSLLVSALKHHLAVFNPEGTGAALATVVALATLCLVLPSFTTSESGPEYSGAQLAFAAVASLSLYAMFVFTQTIRHRDFFLPVDRDGTTLAPGDHVDADGDGHADPPDNRTTARSAGLLVVSLVAVVGLAKIVSPAIEDGVASVGFPHAVVGVVIALLVLLPESIAAVRAAARERVQVSLNLALGSAMASIGLTIPTLAVASIWLEGPLALGLDNVQIVLLFLTVIVGILTVVPGRAKPLQGCVHLVLLASFIFLTIAP
ncbi:MAG: ionic transporter y4hA [Nocardioides sp.]|jgi:Ca2+:H+ antiporter|uniref:calcium:proton antiporter n=1 Tax=Nocardioides sp. TaxID=35761 RepID=UPI0026062FC6|nr:ionic transporter y4hA [Nocardioides sp.]MCW2833390.1 ionic transporter y4hA [Nocardioides sp.]